MVRPSRSGVNVMAAPTTRWMRLAGRLGRDGNPLRRRCDLIACWLLPAAIAAFLVAGPLAAFAADTWVRADNAAARHTQLAWHRGSAVLLQAAPGPAITDNGANGWTAWTPAQWTFGGKPQTGDVPALSGSRADSAVTIWLDRAGTVRMPLTAAQASDRVVAAMLIALAVLAVALTGLTLLARLVLDRRRLASWETDWLAVGPSWSHLD
jgi:hypothetical protein